MAASTFPVASALPLAAPQPAEAPVQAAQIDPAQRASLEKAAVQFEGLFIHQMLKEMRKSTEGIAGDDALFKSQQGNGLLDIADGMVADAMASQRAFGIADTILRQMLPPGSGAQAAPAVVGAGAGELHLPVDAALKFQDPRVALPLERRGAVPSTSNSEPRDPSP
ncbi:MAG: flagellar biosynthesis protein FlgJ [Rhodoferax sp.]|nr:flagellar biosynthesis protein FlgJ [Rhodoferax sp.]